MNFSDTYTWDVDQHIVSYGILNSGYCTLPTQNKLWKELKLEPKYIHFLHKLNLRPRVEIIHLICKIHKNFSTLSNCPVVWNKRYRVDNSKN